MTRLSDPAATAEAARLYALIQRLQGRRILLAQQESPGRSTHDQEMAWLEQITGRLPAIRGLDFIHNDFDGVTDRACRWRDRGGIVTICWHTGLEGIGYRESQAEHPDIGQIVTPGTALNSQWLRRLDAAADALGRLQAAGVPVLWRPYHEFEGRWFWWGKDGPEAFKALWRMTWQDLTLERGLHNLIWVLGFADDAREPWYPGDDAVDIVGSDTYKGVTTHATAWRKLRQAHPGKPAALHECGQPPAPDVFFSEGAVWSWLMPWHGRWLTENSSPERLNALYHDPRFVTLDGLRAAAEEPA